MKCKQSNVSHIQENVIKPSCNIVSSPAHVPEGAAIDSGPSAWVPESMCGIKIPYQFLF